MVCHALENVLKFLHAEFNVKLPICWLFILSGYCSIMPAVIIGFCWTVQSSILEVFPRFDCQAWFCICWDHICDECFNIIWEYCLCLYRIACLHIFSSKNCFSLSLTLVWQLLWIYYIDFLILAILFADISSRLFV